MAEIRKARRPVASTPDVPHWKVDARTIITGFIAERYDRPSRVSEIAATIALDIIDGKYEPSIEINSVSVANRFSTSRTPVREAFLLLEKEGLVILPPRRRPFVPKFTISDIEDNYGLRLKLLCYMAEMIVKRASDKDLETLKIRLNDMLLAGEFGTSDDYFWSNVSYHGYATIIANNQTLKRSLDTLLLGSMRLRRLGMSVPGRVAQSMRDHIAITEALLARDSVLASALIRSNLQGALEAIKTHGGIN
jgi:DNA-binding GntR family transcriptional regulator